MEDNWNVYATSFVTSNSTTNPTSNWSVSATDFVTQCLTGHKSSSRLSKEKIIDSFLQLPSKRECPTLNENADHLPPIYNGYNTDPHKRIRVDTVKQNNSPELGIPQDKLDVNDKHLKECELFLNNISKKPKLANTRERYTIRRNSDYDRRRTSKSSRSSYERDVYYRKSARSEDTRKGDFVEENNNHDLSNENVFKGISNALRNFDKKKSTNPKPKTNDKNVPKAHMDRLQMDQFNDEHEFVKNLEKCIRTKPEKILEIEEKKWTVSATSSHYKISGESDNCEASDENMKLCKMFEGLLNQHCSKKSEPHTYNRPQRRRHRCTSHDDNDDLGYGTSDGKVEEHDCIIKELQLKQQHPNRLHPELWFNDEGELNDGPLCRCSRRARKHGIRHNIYIGEGLVEKCNPHSNNANKLYHYRLVITPSTNLFIKTPTVINFNNRRYTFEGFSLFSHYPIPRLPVCNVIRFNINYSILHFREPIPHNFSIHELDLFFKYFFREILELVDFNLYPSGQIESGCPMFHLMPRFVYSIGNDGYKLLPMCEVIKYLIKSSEPLIHEQELEEISELDDVTWQNRISNLKGMIVTKPGAKPCSLRVDQLDRDLSDHPDDLYPDIVHFGIRPAQLSYAGSKRYQKLWKMYIKYRQFIANLPKPTVADKIRLQTKEQVLNKIKSKSRLKRGVTVVLSSKGFFKTGIMCDMVQHALLMPVLIGHLRFHRSLNCLEKQIHYKFKDRSLLQFALTHPSYRENFGTNPDHVRNTLSNCGIRQPEYGDRSIHYQSNKKRGINTLINIMSKFGKNCEMPSSITHNERLEFLGDAVIELITSVHLYSLFPEIEEGGLATYRSAIVQNQNLTVLAEKLNLDRYLLFAHGSDLCHDLELRHALANCFEALFAALYLDSGLEVADKVFSESLFIGNEHLLSMWMNSPKHPLQEQEPDGDRKWISKFPLLQRLTKLEKSVGIQFTHIRLLARAFTDRSIGYTDLTLGSNERMEFLGDTVLQLICSTYLYKHFPDHHEGHLSLLRSSLVNNRTQSIVCDDLALSSYALYANSKEVYKVKDRADVLEAFLGALYIDKGIEYCEQFCEECFFPRLQEFIVNQHWNDPKSKLQQCCLTLRNAIGHEPDIPIYKVIECKGPTNGRVYKVAVYFKGERLAASNGHNIQQAEMNAARQVLAKSRNLFPRLTYRQRENRKNVGQNYTRDRYDFTPSSSSKHSTSQSEIESSEEQQDTNFLNHGTSSNGVYASGSLGELLLIKKLSKE